MTSTVLDVTVLLLCVSASVVALGVNDAGGPNGPTASDAADRLVTETTTVTYADDGAPNGTRRVHATRAELLALIVERDAGRTFGRRVVESVRAGLGPRTRIDATVESREDEDGGNRAGSGVPAAFPRLTGPAVRGGGGPPAVRRHGMPQSAQVGGASSPKQGAGDTVPARAVNDRGSEAGSAPSNSVAVGPEPPRNADVSAAVVTQPIPTTIGGNAEESWSSEGVVRIVVRRW